MPLGNASTAAGGLSLSDGVAAGYGSAGLAESNQNTGLACPSFALAQVADILEIRHVWWSGIGRGRNSCSSVRLIYTHKVNNSV